METPSAPQEWYYVGHYGQLGPLVIDQIQELVRDGVIERDTYVWCTGMANWERAAAIPILATAFVTSPYAAPPPPPMPGQPTAAPPVPSAPYGMPPTVYAPIQQIGYQGMLPVSDRNRYVAGVLQIVVPGVGRMYLGHIAQGIIQLLLVPFGCGVGWLWSVIDGILILTGSVKLDGYGRRLPD